MFEFLKRKKKTPSATPGVIRGQKHGSSIDPANDDPDMPEVAEVVAGVKFDYETGKLEFDRKKVVFQRGDSVPVMNCPYIEHFVGPVRRLLLLACKLGIDHLDGVRIEGYRERDDVVSIVGYSAEFQEAFEALSERLPAIYRIIRDDKSFSMLLKVSDIEAIEFDEYGEPIKPAGFRYEAVPSEG